MVRRFPDSRGGPPSEARPKRPRRHSLPRSSAINVKLENTPISRDDGGSERVVKGAMDQSKKTMRHFYCRDVLWETFEQMANDFDCSIDYLINEAMRFYARSKNYNAGAAPPS